MFPMRKGINQVVLLLCLSFFLIVGCDDFAFDELLDGEPGTLEESQEATAMISISPAYVVLGLNQACTFSADGGRSPYAFSMLMGTGSVDSNTGIYTAPGTPHTDLIQVTDSSGNSDEGTAIVFEALSISPPAVSLEILNNCTFSASGGLSPYSYSILSGLGTIDESTGFYEASGTTGTTVARVTDSIDSTIDATIQIFPVGALIIDPPTADVIITGSTTFSASGGLAPYSFSVLAVANGSIDTVTGVYTAPAVPCSDVIRVTDALVNTVDAAVTVVPAQPLSIIPISITLNISQTFTFQASGGLAPYAFSIMSGSGSIDTVTGLYTAPPKAEKKKKVQVTDALSTTAVARVTVKK